MGELTRQIMAGGPPLLPFHAVTNCIPGLATDLARPGCDPIETCRALTAAQPRTIPAPHRAYGHLLFGRDIYLPSTEYEDAIRQIASICGSAHGAPVLGSPLGDCPVGQVAAILSACGFPATAEAWHAASDRRRACELERVAGARVWEVPEHLLDPEITTIAGRCVAVMRDSRRLDGTDRSWRFLSCDLAVFGERISQDMPSWVRIPGIPHFFAAFDRAFDHDWRGMTEAGRDRLISILVEHCGQPRSVRLFGLDE